MLQLVLLYWSATRTACKCILSMTAWHIKLHHVLFFLAGFFDTFTAKKVWLWAGKITNLCIPYLDQPIVIQKLCTTVEAVWYYLSLSVAVTQSTCRRAFANKCCACFGQTCVHSSASVTNSLRATCAQNQVITIKRLQKNIQQPVWLDGKQDCL